MKAICDIQRVLREKKRIWGQILEEMPTLGDVRRRRTELVKETEKKAIRDWR